MQDSTKTLLLMKINCFEIFYKFYNGFSSIVRPEIYRCENSIPPQNTVIDTALSSCIILSYPAITLLFNSTQPKVLSPKILLKKSTIVRRRKGSACFPLCWSRSNYLAMMIQSSFVMTPTMRPLLSFSQTLGLLRKQFHHATLIIFTEDSCPVFLAT